LGFSATDTLTGLLAGAAVVPFDIRGQALLSLGKFLRTEEITYFIAIPSVFRYFAQELDDREEFPRLRMIKLGGEPLFKADVEQYKKHFSPNCLLLNQLSANEMGPTCQYWITTQSEIDTSIVPVGYPVEGKKVLLLDDEQKEVDVDQIGEIAVASRYLSSGYWNKSELTNDKFSQREQR
jgi:non-ribosomal peptide synthetase component F